MIIIDATKRVPFVKQGLLPGLHLWQHTLRHEPRVPLVKDAGRGVSVEVRVLDVVRVGAGRDGSGVIDDASVRYAETCEQSLQTLGISRWNHRIGAA